MLLRPPYRRNRTLTLQAALAVALMVSITAALPLLRQGAGGQLPLPFAAPIAPSKAASLTLPISFEPNAGQAGASARYIAHTSGGVLLFAPSEVTLLLSHQAAPTIQALIMPGSGDAPEGITHATGGKVLSSTVELSFVGSSPAASIQATGHLPGKVNYLIGNDPAGWHRDLPTFGQIVYTGLYPGIDLAYSGTQAQLKGTYTVAPGADPSQIHWQYKGAQLRIDSAGNLQISVTGNQVSGGSSEVKSITEQAPSVWQEINGSRVAVSSRYLLYDDNTVGFELGSYDTTQALTIDPTIIYSTYLGGFYRDDARSIALDQAGNIYVTGNTSSSDFPLSTDPYQPGYGGGHADIFVSKLSADGSTLLYSTFLGGDGDDYGQFVRVDAQGNATVGGSSTSTNYPTTPGVYQPQFQMNEDVVVTKLNAAGSDLVYSTYWGGGGLDTNGFTDDANGDIYFTGYIFLDLYKWAFAAAINSDGTQQIFSKYLGGDTRGPGDVDANTEGEGIALDPGGNIYVTGYTRAADFPITQGAFRTTLQAYEDGFVTALKASDHSIAYSTFIPGDLSDYPFDITTDAGGNAYITGFTSSSDYWTTPGAYETSAGDFYSSFLTKVNPNGTDLVFSTYLGGADPNSTTTDSGEVVRLDSAGRVYIAGYTSSPDFPTVNAIQSTRRGDSDAFVTIFNTDGTDVDFSTYIGGNDADYALGMTLTGSGDIYLAGGTVSTDLPVVQPYQASNHGDYDAFIMRITQASGTPTPTSTGTPPTATPTTCVPGYVAWHTEQAITIGRDYASGAVVGGNFYVIGGINLDYEPPYIDRVERFDPSTGIWDTAAPIPVAASSMAAVTIGTKLYLVGGFTTRNGFTIDLMQIYDSATNTWSQGAHMPTPLKAAAAAVYDGKIYIFGGGTPSTDSDLVFEYDPAADTYTQKRSLPIRQQDIGAATAGNRIYVMGGYDYLHLAYDPVTDTYSTIAAPPTPNLFADPGVFALNGEVWVEGGYDQLNFRGIPPDQEIQIYNPGTNSWRLGPAFNQPRMRSTAAGALDGRAYVAAGLELNNDDHILTSVESLGEQACGTQVPTTATPSNTAVARTATATTTATTTAIATPISTGTAFASSTTAATATATSMATVTVQATATVTGTIPANPTRTPQVSPTACSIEFSDVPVGSTYYPYVHCLACLGIINGYANGTFKPNNNVTRGQLSKIVSNAAGLHQPIATQLFQDVPQDNSFFLYINRLASQNLISGYPCGGPGEPCIAPDNLPYFRPNNNATRGQITKIDANAAGFENPPNGQQFEDVAAGSTYYIYTSRLVERGIMSGYPCGGPGEPCIAPRNLPYFRPNYNATRGQTSKIVSGTFFPACQAPKE